MSAAAAVAPIDPGLAADLFPAAVATHVGAIDATLADLLPEERAAMLRAVPKRQREFATGRRTARALLAELGLGRPALPRNADRTVAWPDAVAGSISHCDDLCAVAVARRGSAINREGAIDALGIDVEPDQPLEPALWPRIATPRDLDRVVRSQHGAFDQGRAARFLFCAKEAFYKSVHARVGRVLGFQEVEIQVDWKSGRFLAWLEGTRTGAPDGTRFEGRFARREGYVLAAATLHLEATEGTAR